MEEFHLKEDRTLRPWVVRVGETIFDLTLNAQHLRETGQIEIEDSRELFSSILVWAREFESEHKDPWDAESGTADYLEAIDAFAEEKLLEKYGSSGANVPGSVPERRAEFQRLLSFVEEECFDVEICCRQLRSLWTAYCLHNGLQPDTSGYDNDLLTLWEAMQESEPDTAYWSGYDSFDTYLCENLV